MRYVPLLTCLMLVLPLTAQAAEPNSAAYVSQIRDMAVPRSVAGGSAVTLSQSGTNNHSQVQQTSAGQAALIEQSGDDNISSVTQSGLEGNLLHLMQSGSANVAVVQQQAFTTGNAAKITQNGTGNEAGLTQMGNANSAVLEQNGNDNQMLVSQTHDNNNITWTQSGSNLSMPKVDMTGNQTMTINQIGMP